MDFHTPLHITPSPRPIEHHQRVFMIGSCFSENMAEKLANGGIQCASNPFGVLYNPLSICACIDKLIEGKPFSEEQLVYYGGLYHSMLHHGCFSAPDKNTALQRINNSLEWGRKALLEADTIIITLGSAYVYTMDGYVVGNCHKMPDKRFIRRKLTTHEIVDALQNTLQKPPLAGKKVIFTVSPIRHIKDGLHQNQLSKSTLLLAINQLIEQAEQAQQTAASEPTYRFEYFPSYEIMIDELRDYRFYADDMLHPSQLAINYIWQRFCECQFSAKARSITEEISAFNKKQAHRPIHANTSEYLLFKAKLQDERSKLLSKYPYLNLPQENNN